MTMTSLSLLSPSTSGALSGAAAVERVGAMTGCFRGRPRPRFTESTCTALVVVRARDDLVVALDADRRRFACGRLSTDGMNLTG